MAPRFGLAGDEQIIGADQRPSPLQLGSDLPGHACILPIKVKDTEIGEEEPERFEVERDLFAAVGTEIEFMRDHRRNGK